MEQLFIHIGKKAAILLVMAFCLLCPAFSYATPDFDITLSADNSEVRQGEQVTFTVTVHNRSSNTITDLLVVDSLPKGVLLLSCSVADVTVSGRNLIIKMPSLRSGEDYTFDVALRIDRKGSLEKMIKLQRAGFTVKTASTKVNVLSSNVLDIKVNMFTPNGDGVNDYFEIAGLLDYPNNELVIFNRYSDKVYQKRGYANEWDAAGLPHGNYFYILTLYLDNGVVQKYNGYVTVRR